MEHIKINWQKQILKSELPAPAKLLMLTLSIYMDPDGSKCFPSISELECATGLTRNTVKKHLRLAIEKNILRAGNAGFSGAKKQQKIYFPILNTGGQEMPPTQKRGSNGDQRGSGDAPNHTITIPIKDKRPFSSDSIEIKLSQKLFSYILERDPKHKKPDLQEWGVHIDRLIRINKRSPEEIAKVITWCQTDSFWQNNVLCTEKLRKQFDQLTLKMNGDKSKTKPYRPTRVVV